MEDSNVGLVIGVAATAITSLAALFTQMVTARAQRLREERNRKWDLEDRKGVAQVNAEKTQALHSAITEARRSTLIAIADNTKKTEESTKTAKDARSEVTALKQRLDQKFEQIGARFKPPVQGPPTDGA